jgi:hypothetical protein
MVKWLSKLFKGKAPENIDYSELAAAQHEASSVPWASFEIADFESGERIKVKFNWNPAFINRIKELGFQAETDEDTVQLFFYTASMRPTQLAGTGDPEDDAVQSTSHPLLSNIQNEIRI